MTVSSNTTALRHESKESTDLVSAVHRIIALATVLRNTTVKYGEMPEVCKIPDEYFHQWDSRPPGELFAVAEILFDLAYDNYSDLVEASNKYLDYLKARKEATNGDN